MRPTLSLIVPNMRPTLSLIVPNMRPTLSLIIPNMRPTLSLTAQSECIGAFLLNSLASMTNEGKREKGVHCSWELNPEYNATRMWPTFGHIRNRTFHVVRFSGVGMLTHLVSINLYWSNTCIPFILHVIFSCIDLNLASLSVNDEGKSSIFILNTVLQKRNPLSTPLTNVPCDTSITILLTYTSITVYFYRRGRKESKTQKRWVSHCLPNYQVFYPKKIATACLILVFLLLK